MTTLTTLDAEYADVLRIPVALIPANDSAILVSLARSVDAGQATLAMATAAISRLAVNTTDVAVLSYQFFTGATPLRSGLDYLISPNGGNANNLNSAYYQTFNVENRFINFAVNLGKNGEGASRFSATYASLSLADTAAQAYTTIFGTAPSASQVSAFLNDQVPNGMGGSETRAQYFAYYGLDGPSGLGTKAALVGWLLAQAAKEDVGVYAKANDAFLADLAPDGLARLHVDLVAAYGPKATSAAGAAITFSASQSVSLTSADPALRSTNNADTLTGAGGLNGGQSIQTGNGNDTLTIPGLVYGAVAMGDGDNLLTISGGLGNSALNGDPRTNPGPYYRAAVTLGGGNNTVYLASGSATGTSVTATGLNNVLHLGGTPGQDATSYTGYSGAITGFQTIYYDAVAGYYGSENGLAPGLQTVIVDIPTSVVGATLGLVESVGETVVLQNTAAALLLGGTDSNGLTVFLDHYQGAPTTQVSSGRGFYNANGGAITVHTPGGASDATLTLHVSSDSTAGLIYGYTTSYPLFDYMGPFPNLVITGAGSLTAQISGSFTQVDATGAGDLNLAYAVGNGGTLSAPTFLLSKGKDALTVSYASASTTASPVLPTKFVFSTGADTFMVAGPSLANLFVTSAQTVYTPTEIDGFKKGVDHLVLDAVTTSLTVGVQAYVGTAATLTQALTNVSAHVAANTGAVFEYGGDTYIYQQDATVGLNTGDGLIRLVGVTALTTASGGGTGDIHVHG